MKLLLKACFLIFLIITLPICFAQNLVYDANGNLVTGDGFFRVYNSLNQLYRIYNGSNTSILLEEYVYHPIEERVWIKKTFNASGNVTETVYYLSKEFVMLVNKTGTFNYTYVYLDEQLVAQVFSSSGVINQPDGPEGDGISPLPSQITTTQFILTDHKGSVVVVTNASGGVIENTTYSPYGQIQSGGTKSRYDYEGKEYDSVTKTLDFHFRHINPNNQFWEQPDDRIYPYDPQKLNRYMFERGNPWKNVDPSGHWIQVAYYASRFLAWYFSDPVRVTRTIGSIYLKLENSGALSVFESQEVEYRVNEGTYVPPEARGFDETDDGSFKLNLDPSVKPWLFERENKQLKNGPSNLDATKKKIGIEATNSNSPLPKSEKQTDGKNKVTNQKTGKNFKSSISSAGKITPKSRVRHTTNRRYTRK